MPAKRYLIHYPDGSKEQVSPEQRSEMELRGELRQIDGKRYHFVGVFVAKELRCKGFGGLSVLLQEKPAEQGQRYLDRLEVLWKMRDEQEWQSEERPEAFVKRLQAMGMPVAGFEAAA